LLGGGARLASLSPALCVAAERLNVAGKGSSQRAGGRPRPACVVRMVGAVRRAFQRGAGSVVVPGPASSYPLVDWSLSPGFDFRREGAVLSFPKCASEKLDSKPHRDIFPSPLNLHDPAPKKTENDSRSQICALRGKSSLGRLLDAGRRPRREIETADLPAGG